MISSDRKVHEHKLRWFGFNTVRDGKFIGKPKVTGKDEDMKNGTWYRKEMITE